MLDFKGHIDEGKQLPAAFFPFKIKKKKKNPLFHFESIFSKK